MNLRNGFQLGIGCVWICLISTPFARAQQKPSPTLPTNEKRPAQSATPKPVSPDEIEKHRLLIWEQRLSQVAAREQAALFVDIPEQEYPPHDSLAKPFGVHAMRTLAASIGRLWSQPEGIQAFSRVNAQLSKRAVRGEMYAWLESMDQQTFKALNAGYMTINNLDQSASDVVLGLAAGQTAVGSRIMDNPEGVRISLDMAPRFTFTDPKTGQSKTVELGMRTRPDGLFKPGDKLPANVTKLRSILPLDKPMPGKLDFGTGKVLTLVDIVGMATDAFGIRYEMDVRTAKNMYFVSGKYTEKAFQSALAILTAVPAVKPKLPIDLMQSDIAFLSSRIASMAASNLDVSFLRDQLTSSSDDTKALQDKFGSTEQISSEGFLNGATVSAASLFNNNPGLANYLQQQGVGADYSIKLGFGVQLTIGCSGVSDVDQGWFNGQWTVGNVANQLTYRLK